MVKRLSISLMERLFLIRDTIEHTLFYVALAGILLCAILFLAIPSTISARDSSAKPEDLTITLAGAGTERAEDELLQDIMDSDPVYVQLIRSCCVELGRAYEKAQESAELSAAPASPLSAASAIGYSAINAVEKERRLSYTDYSTLLQIVEAECTGGDERSKQYVACVVLNRTKDDHFPDTVYDVVWQRVGGQAQFSPTQDGRMGTLKITDSTIHAVEKAISGEDISRGALFFIAKEHAAKGNVDWFESKLEYLFAYGGHEFYKFKDE